LGKFISPPDVPGADLYYPSEDVVREFMKLFGNCSINRESFLHADGMAAGI
jgi:hypothetical protein